MTTQTTTDNELMFQVKAGDLDKMAVLFQRHSKALYGFFWYMLKQKELSEDLVQTVFMRMLNSRHTFNGTGKFETWMFHIARNILKDQYRKDKHRAGYYDLSVAEEQKDHDPVADMHMQRKQENETLFKAMDKLGKEDKELLILARFREMKYSEIGSLLKISEGAVKVRVFRALNQLKKHYLALQNENCIV